MAKKNPIEQATEFRLAAHNNGYLTVPVAGIEAKWANSPGKQPGLGSDWLGKARSATLDDIETWSTNAADCTNTGILTEGVAAFDIDIDHPALAQRIFELVMAEVGENALTRSRGGPRKLVLCGAEQGITKMTTAAYKVADDQGNEVSCKLEVLATGQQFVAHGMHPSGHLYEWEGGSPADTPVFALPIISKWQIQRILDEATAILDEAAGVQDADGTLDKPDRRPIGDPKHFAPSDDVLIGAVEAMDNDLDYDGWVKMTAAIKAAARDHSGVYPAFETWSLKYTGNTEKDAKQKWDSVKTSSVGWSHVAWKAGVPVVKGGLKVRFSDMVISCPALAAMELPETEYIINPWLPKAGLAMVSAERGVGKTFFALSLAVCVARGQRKFLGHYTIPGARRVLYIDGELTIDQLQKRMQALSRVQPSNLSFLTADKLFEADEALNIANPAHQAWIEQGLRELEEQGQLPDLIIADNLSALTSGVDENDNSAQDGILAFFRRLRHRRIAALFIHHDGKNGKQRGASRREDFNDTSIDLGKVSSDGPPQGAEFKLKFTKTRGMSPNPYELHCMLTEVGGFLEWTTKREDQARNIDLLKLIYDYGHKQQKDYIPLLGVDKSRVSQLVRELHERGCLERKDLTITSVGMQALADAYPDENIPVQPDLDINNVM